jgi:hypothetical protein
MNDILGLRKQGALAQPRRIHGVYAKQQTPLGIFLQALQRIGNEFA